jgi:hypothetical protein
MVRTWFISAIFLTISLIAANVLSMQMNFSEKSERSLLDMQGTISTRYANQTVVRSYDQAMLILMKMAMKDDNQPIAGSFTAGPRGPTPNTDGGYDVVVPFK